MSDEAARDVERRAAAGAEDEVAALRARLRAGTLDAARLGAAALLGHEAAARAVSAPAPPAALPELVRALGAWGPVPVVLPALMRAALAAARRACERVDLAGEECALEAVRTAERRLAGTERRLARGGDHEDDADGPPAGLEAELNARLRDALVQRAVEGLAGEAPAAGDERTGAVAAAAAYAGHAQQPADVLGEVDDASVLEGALDAAVQAALASAHAVGEAPVREALRDDVVPWLLGAPDPVAARVERERGLRVNSPRIAALAARTLRPEAARSLGFVD